MTQRAYSALEDRIMENIQSEQQKEKQILKLENSLRDLWNNIKHNNIYITEILEGEERTKKVKGYLMKLRLKTS